MRHRRRLALVTVVLVATATAAAAGPTGAAGRLQGPAPALPTITAQQLLGLASIDAPEPGTGLRIHADFPASNPLRLGDQIVYSLTADITPEGSVLVRNAVTRSTAQSGGPAVDGCNDPAFAPTGVTWGDGAMPIRWFFRFRSVPDGVAPFTTQAAVRKAHQVWPRQITDCRTADPNSFQFRYMGRTPNKTVYDGTNTVAFGSLKGPLAVAYTWYRGSRIVEVDLRLNRSQYRWTNLRGGDGAYQVVNVATHEIGHHLGLDDLNDPHGALTMYGVIGKGEMRKTTLGRGDMKGAQTLSP